MEKTYIEYGYILLARKIKDEPLLRDLTGDQFKVAITCLLNANYTDREWFDGNKMITIKRGQFITSRDKLVKLCGKGLTERKVRTSLSKLQKLQFLTKQAASQHTTITIRNYDKYQNPDNYERPSKRPASDQVATSKRPQLKKDKKEKKEKNMDEPEELVHQVKEFLFFCNASFKEKYRDKMNITATDKKLVKDLLSEYGFDKLKELWTKLIILSDTDPYIKKTGIGIGIFKSQINKLLSAGKRVRYF